MFKTCRYKVMYYNNDHSIRHYHLVDDDFDCIITSTKSRIEAVVDEYVRRGERIGENLAMFAIWYNDQYQNKVEESISRQNSQLENINNKEEIIRERDKFLKLRLVWD